MSHYCATSNIVDSLIIPFHRVQSTAHFLTRRLHVEVSCLFFRQLSSIRAHHLNWEHSSDLWKKMIDQRLYLSLTTIIANNRPLTSVKVFSNTHSPKNTVRWYQTVPGRCRTRHLENVLESKRVFDIFGTSSDDKRHPWLHLANGPSNVFHHSQD